MNSHISKEQVFLEIYVLNENGEIDFNVEDIKVPRLTKEIEKYEPMLKGYETIKDIKNASEDVRKAYGIIMENDGHIDLISETFDNHTYETESIINDDIVPFMKENNITEGTFTVELGVGFSLTQDWTGEFDVESNYEIAKISLKEEFDKLETFSEEENDNFER